jgi:hypothetical protein
MEGIFGNQEKSFVIEIQMKKPRRLEIGMKFSPSKTFSPLLSFNEKMILFN